MWFFLCNFAALQKYYTAESHYDTFGGCNQSIFGSFWTISVLFIFVLKKFPGAIYPGSAGAGSVEGSSTTVPQSSNFESSVTQSLSHHYQAPFSYTNNYHHHPHLPRHHPYSGYGKHHEMGSWAQGLLAQAAYGNGSRLAPTATSTTGQQYSDRQSVSPTYQGKDTYY